MGPLELVVIPFAMKLRPKQFIRLKAQSKDSLASNRASTFRCTGAPTWTEKTYLSFAWSHTLLL